MQRLVSSIVSVILVASAASAALFPDTAAAQAEAQQAFQAARAAFQEGKFARARDLAQKASQTDPDNPEVHLLLGKAHYQLGNLDEALAAWKRTLQLAPEEPYTAGMLAALRSQQVGVDVRIKLIGVMTTERLYSPALQECRRLLGEKATSDSQRAKVMTMQANLLVRTAKYPDAQKVLRRLAVLYPKQLDPVQTALLTGQAKLRGDEKSMAEAIATLRKVVADHPDTPTSALAQYELIAFDLRQGVDPARTEALAVWLAANPNHELSDQGRHTLFSAYLSLTRQGTKPQGDAQLSKTDVTALAVAAELYKRSIKADQAKNLIGRLLKHVQEHYANHGAYTAAVAATDALLAAPLSRADRLSVLKNLGLHKYRIAMEWLKNQGRAGQFPAAAGEGGLPQVLADVLAVYQTIRQEYPAEPLWKDQIKLAAEVRQFSAAVPWPREVAQPRSPEAWALQLAWPVVQADADAEAVKRAVELILAVGNEIPRTDAASRQLAVSFSTKLLQTISADHAMWPVVVTAYYTQQADYAAYVFQENVKAGRPVENAKLSAPQEAVLSTLEKHLSEHVAHAPHALAQLAEFSKPLIAHGHWALAEEAYLRIAKALPEAQRREAELAVANLWIRQVAEEHQRLSAAGLTVPRRLDTVHVKVLTRCYTLQDQVADTPAELKKVRDLCDQVVNHYKGLEYYDVAEAAIQVKTEEAVEAADEYAAFGLVRLKDELARRDLQRLLKQYGASEKIELGAAFEAVIAGWTKFIADRSGSPLVAQAVEHIFAVGQLFEQKGSHGVAAAIYGDFAKAASEIAVLSQSTPGAASVAQRAAFAAAGALDAKGRTALAKLTAGRKSEDPPPAALSEEFTAAVGAYKGFVETYPDSPLVAQGLAKVMAVAYEYAKIDAWDVADSLYADLLASKLAIRRPERLEFARGLCQLGRAMPQHAREVLEVLTGGGLRGSGETVEAVMLAMTGGGVGGGVGGMGMAGGSGPAKPPAAARPADERAERDVRLLAMIRRQESSRATQVAQLRGRLALNRAVQPQAKQAVQQAEQGQQALAPVVLSPAELARQEKAIAAAYEIFQAIRKQHPHTPTAVQARGEVLVMVGHWRGLSQWERSAALVMRFLADNPADGQLPKLRLEIARDRLAWASKPLKRKVSKQEILAEVSRRFDAARSELAKIVAEFPKQREYQQQAQWEIAASFLTQARVVNSFSPTLARGQYVRATKELGQVAAKHPNHPQIGKIPQMLWEISAELEGRGYDREAILVWNELTIHDPMHELSQQAALKIAQTYHRKLKRPLRAAEAYQELNFARGGSDQNLQNAIFQIGSELKNQKRWVEALHVLESFVDSFPGHEKAGQALTMVGQIHQANEAWADAIAAYRRVIAEFKNGQWSQDAKWAIAECTINLSQWHQASEAYRAYVEAYPKDAKVEEAKRRIEVLKDLERYQGLVDEEGQRKAFDAQYQIAVIVGGNLANPVKAIIEYRKVTADWSESHLADDALYAIGTTYLSLGETEKSREALLQAAEKYPASPLADDALFMVGKSHEDEAAKLATVTREKTIEEAKDVAQRKAYKLAQSSRRMQQQLRSGRIASLKKAGKGQAAEAEEASTAANYAQFNEANVKLFAQKAGQEVEVLTAAQLADRQDKINTALRKAVESFTAASKVAGADKADEALLQMATIYDERLKDSAAAMQTWLEIVRQFSGTAVAEDASWRIAQYHQRKGKFAAAIEAYKAFLRNYRRSPKAGAAQFAVAENNEKLDQWVKAMDAYTNYMTNFPEGPLVAKAKEQINWIKTYRL